MTSTPGRVVLVTGCSSGIGLRTAVAAARAGFATVATMRDPDRSEPLRKAAADAGVSVDVRRLDLTDQSTIDSCLSTVVDEYGRLDALVNNAGVANGVPTIEMCSMEAYRAQIEVNFLGVVAVTRAALPALRESRGRIVTIGSSRGLIAQPFNEAYSAAKFAVEGFMEALAPVAAGLGMTVVMVEPGPVLETSFAANSGVTFDSLLAAAGPYRGVLETYLEWVKHTAWPGAQPAAEVADIVVRTLTEPDPPFRVLTSDWVRGFVSQKYADPDGRAIQLMTRSWTAGTS
jgi:NAD(P)-dependent dehydrogenase (short-subunit alcohol dehydrogenase family)